MVTGTDALTIVSVGTLLGILGVTSERIRDVDAVSSLGENHPRVRLIASILFHGSLGGMLASVSGGELPLMALH